MIINVQPIQITEAAEHIKEHKGAGYVIDKSVPFFEIFRDTFKPVITKFRGIPKDEETPGVRIVNHTKDKTQYPFDTRFYVIPFPIAVDTGICDGTL